MEEEVLMQRREEEGKGRERRKALLEKEERKWKELEISLLSSIPNAGSRDAAAMAAAVRAVGGDSALEDSFARDRVSSIALHIRKAQLARRAEQVLFPLYLYLFFMVLYAKYLHFGCTNYGWPSFASLLNVSWFTLNW